jgi:hypothetical protein
MPLVQVLLVVIAAVGFLCVNLYIVYSCKGRDELGLAPPEAQSAGRGR